MNEFSTRPLLPRRFEGYAKGKGAAMPNERRPRALISLIANLNPPPPRVNVARLRSKRSNVYFRCLFVLQNQKGVAPDVSSARSYGSQPDESDGESDGRV